MKAVRYLLNRKHTESFLHKIYNFNLNNSNYMKKLVLFFVALITLAWSASAAVFSTSPSLLQESSRNVKIIFNANECDVAGLKTATELYAHIGVTLTSAPSDWKYVKGEWSTNTADKKFTKTSAGIWELNIGDIRSYFGITNAADQVAKIAVIARTPTGDAQTKDYFLDVLPEGYQMALTSNATSYVISSATSITFNVEVTQASEITLAVDGTTIATASNATTLSKAYNFSQQGHFYNVKATAKKGGETLTQELTVAYPEPASAATYPGGVPKQGAVKNADGTVTFCLAAPGKQSVILVPSWDNYQTLGKNVMKYQDYKGYRYFWITTATKLDDHTYYPYYYLVDGTVKVADPYARIMLDPYSDKWMPTTIFPDVPRYPYELFEDTMLAVYRGDIDDYNWDEATTKFQIPDKRSLNIYELLLRDFTGDGSDQDGKTFGTFRTAMAKIPYLQRMGINAVELLPVMEFAGNSSWGYNTNGYMALDKAYGSPKDMRDFVAECHRRGIAVILDIVFNQSDGLHPWYQMYPVESNPFFNAEAPHAYSVLNDWNQDYPLVAQHWEDVLRFWMEEYKVDGFRFDLVKGLGSNSSYSGGTDRYNATRVQKMKDLHAVITSVNPAAIHINELLGDASEDNAMGADGQLNWNKVSNAAYAFAQGVASQSANVKGFYANNWGRIAGQTVDYAESHDEPRVANKIKTGGNASVKYTSKPKIQTIQRLGSLAAQMLMMPGSKMIWQFGELAADDNQGADLEKLRAIAPKWDDENDDRRAALQEAYRWLLLMRLNNNDMFIGGEVTPVLTGFNDINNTTTPRTIRLTKGNREIIAFFNPATSGSQVDVSCASTVLTPENSQLIVAGLSTTPTLVKSGSNVSVKLPAHSFAVYATKNMSSVDEITEDLIGGNAASVYGDFGRIVIEGDYTTAEVFDVKGMQYGSLEVPAGFYVVRVDGISHKVLVK